jgi:leucyl/phenylalanyl-tRNA--protein transferase
MLYRLSEELRFPSPLMANADGLLAVGGDLSEQRLILAYRMGIFPWYSQGDPPLWWSPDPRLLLLPQDFHVSGSLKRVIQKQLFGITFDTAFEQVVAGCAERRPKSGGTWIVPEMAKAYQKLHRIGVAHSVEAWQEGRLAGGLYGISLGGCFFGESMFSRIPNASKVALEALIRFVRERGFDMVDCQVTSPHLISLGAKEVPRRRFLEMLEKSMAKPTLDGRWAFETCNH